MSDDPQQQQTQQQPSVPEPPAADGSEGSEQVTISREAFDNMRSAADRKIQASAVQRENQLLKAGVNTESQIVQSVINSEQELTDELVTELKGVGSAGQQEGGNVQQPESEGPELQPGEAGQTRERQDLAAGAQPQDGQPQSDPFHDMQSTFEDRMTKGATREAAMGQALGDLLASDDPRTFVQSDAAFDQTEVR